MSRVNVDVIAFTDARFAHLANLLGLTDHDHARSKVEYLWLECTLRGVTELPLWVVEAKLGAGSAGALVEAQLARFTSGRGDSNTRLMHICGAERCLWLTGPTSKFKGQQSKGGKVRASGASRAGGRFTSSRPAAAGDDAGGSTSSPSPSPSPSHTPEREESDSAPAGGDPDPQTSPSQPPEDRRPIAVQQSASVLHLPIATRPKVDPTHRGIALRMWEHAAVEHGRLKARGIGQTARPWIIAPDVSGAPFEALTERIGELETGARERVTHRIAIAVVEAEELGHLDYFTPTLLWRKDQFYTAEGMSVEQARSRARARRNGNKAAEDAPMRKFTFGAED